MNQLDVTTEITAADRDGSVLVVTTCWWPSLARFVHLLAVEGRRVAVLCPLGHSARLVPGVTIFEQRTLSPIRALSNAIAAYRPAMVVPADDRAVAHLHQLHRTGSGQERGLIERSLGSPEGYSVTLSRIRLLETARRLKIPVPESASIATAAELRNWLARVPGPWVLKVDGTWGGTGVSVLATPREAKTAFRRLSGRLNWRALKRLLVNRDPFWAADCLRRARPAVSAQAHIRGTTGNLAMFCQDGKVLAAIVAETVACRGRTGQSTIVRLVDRPDIVANAGRLAQELRLTGFYGLDFMVDEATGQALLIELNPRVTPLANIRLEPGRDLIGAAATVLSGVLCLPPKTMPSGDLVAHFPIAWNWNRDNALLAACFQDVPWDEPALMADMLRPSWPDRRLLARATRSFIRMVQHLGRVRFVRTQHAGATGAHHQDGSYR